MYVCVWLHAMCMMCDVSAWFSCHDVTLVTSLNKRLQLIALLPGIRQKA
jgi:hypothetical protein